MIYIDFFARCSQSLDTRYLREVAVKKAVAAAKILAGFMASCGAVNRPKYLLGVLDNPGD